MNQPSDITRPFYAIDDPEHPAPRDREIEGRWEQFSFVEDCKIRCITQNSWQAYREQCGEFKWRPTSTPTHWRPILDAETGEKAPGLFGEMFSSGIIGTPQSPSSPPPAPSATPEMIAFIQAHRACHSAEHDPINGKIHGYCLVCGVPWPCEYAKPDILAAALAAKAEAETALAAWSAAK